MKDEYLFRARTRASTCRNGIVFDSDVRPSYMNVIEAELDLRGVM